MAGSRFYLVREHFTNPAGVHTSCAASSTGITLRFGSDGVFVAASAAAAERAWRFPYQANANNRRYAAATIAQDFLTSIPSWARSNNRL